MLKLKDQILKKHILLTTSDYYYYYESILGFVNARIDPLVFLYYLKAIFKIHLLFDLWLSRISFY